MDVLALQRALNARGYNSGEPDGRFGPRTKAALEAFQADAGLVVDGNAGPLTQAALQDVPAASKALDKRSEDRLKQVHPDLVEVVRRAAEITGVPFVVAEGPRTLARQKQLLAKGASQTLRSRHIPGGKLNVSHAVDLAAKVGGVIRWDWPLYDRLGTAMKQAAQDVNVPLEWGGDWRTFKDGPHFQLPWAKYPA